MPTEETATFGYKLRYFLRAQRFPLSVLVLAIGILLATLAIFDLTPLHDNASLQSINQVTDQSSSNGPNYDLAFALIGPLTCIVGLYLVGAYYLSRRRFEHLMVTKSKAEFLRNIPDLEDLLWDLTPNDESRYEAKKSELRVRR